MNPTVPTASAPLLTRIVTVYRQWDCIARWIDDPALADPRVEWIFVNDAEGDPAPAALRQTAVGRQARFVEEGINRGRSGARNHGAALASAPFLAHVDGDDLPLPLPPTFAPPEADLLFLPFACEGKGDGESWSENRIDTAVFGELFRALGVAGDVDWRPAALVWRREAFGRIGGYDGRFEGAEDAHVVWKALRPGLGFRTARGERALVAVASGGARSGLVYLTSGRLRFWEEVERTGGTLGAIGHRARSVQLRVVFWTIRNALIADGGPFAGVGEGLKMGWNTIRHKMISRKA
ncbi:Glycosyl transferase family 2 [Verrucomicrobium sp. GAS474]|uniref:glycosyltransferase family 2 protein n=1 Tax=Verrucomicrobium sp. GAS474 TaxID=1882831 RepID=UPI00087DC8E7|nr:glycosyltransferase family A protein [Verrucomicrobium sp. GAS474]SDT86148.1 Glycosyl transferase family 2 [Verrucomicrobium sp. GAS474]